MLLAFHYHMILSATSNLINRHSEKSRRCFPKHCYWISFLSLVSLSDSFGSSSTTGFSRPLHTTKFLSAASGDLKELSVVQLKERLREVGLPVSGRKSVLVARLVGSSPKSEMAPSKRAKSSAKVEAADETKKKSPRKRTRETEQGASEEPKKKSPARKKKSTTHQRITDRDEIPRLWDSEKAQKNGSYSE